MLETDSINIEYFFIKSLTDLDIDVERAKLLQSIALYISIEIKKNSQINLNYICTHNSRRSQLAQVWSSYATQYFKLSNFESFSGGTAVTAFFRNTVKTLQQAGFHFQISEFSHQNPRYSISFQNCINPIIAFSKLYNHKQNKKPFIAITTCSIADENCPFIPGAIQRFHLPYKDPKTYDATSHRAEKYLETNKQIAGEIHYIFKLIKKSL